MIGFQENRANELVVARRQVHRRGRSEPIFGRAAKLATLVELREVASISTTSTRWRSATAPTISRMIQAAGLGVAYHAKPAVAAAAAARIDHGDLTALLYAQGYRRDEFVEA